MIHPVDHAAGKDPDFRILDPVWFNAGPEPRRLAQSVLTPTSSFFTRNHGVVPTVPVAAWRVTVGGLVERPLEVGLAELQGGRFPIRTVAATLVCAGLRRSELIAHRDVPGELPWGLEPAATATWAGVPLAAVLAAVGVAEGGLHVELTGADEVERHHARFGFGGSIPLAKALAGEVLLAWEMNGAPLPAVHGAPLRLVVPGYIGARSVKWVTGITVRAAPSGNYFQREAYRVLREPGAGNPRDVSTGTELGEVPLNAVILSPEPLARVRPGPLVVRGWAIGHGGAPLHGVEVSLDEGRSWHSADLEPGGDPWTWRLWRVTVAASPGRRMLLARATDRAGRLMPETIDQVWNVKGYANNAWHRVPVDVAE